MVAYYWPIDTTLLRPGQINKHLMTRRETLNVPQREDEGEHYGRGEYKTHCFPRGQSLSVLLHLTTLK